MNIFRGHSTLPMTALPQLSARIMLCNNSGRKMTDMKVWVRAHHLKPFKKPAIGVFLSTIHH